MYCILYKWFLHQIRPRRNTSARIRTITAASTQLLRQFMPPSEPSTFIILGLTTAGKRFRPSDWAERLCGVMCAFGAERKMKYSPYVGPGEYNGEKAVFVDGRLNEIEPEIYRFILDFAHDNELQIEDGVCPVEPGRSK